ncbi:MAG: AAA family ATPase [Saprospiraceae bacterium]|nr:AAA family ATPase [Saprospiraceae bacterium]
MLALQQQLQAQYHSFADLSTEITMLEITIQQQEQQLLELAKVLSEKRQVVAPQFAQQVEQMLHELAMEHAKIKIEFSQVAELLPSGADHVSYLFAANKGSRLLPIKDVASGGEQSRLALVTKSLVASAIPLPTLVFDEIDTGISGYVAQKMGDILRNLSNGHQVVSITHSPQVASKADTHYYVYKRLKNDRTVTQIKELTLDERVHVIAVMLSSDPPSEFAIQNARELVNGK